MTYGYKAVDVPDTDLLLVEVIGNCSQEPSDGYEDNYILYRIAQDYIHS